MMLLVYLCMAAIGVGNLFCLARFFMGPTTADRMMAMDTLALNLVVMVALAAIAFGTGTYFALVLVFSLLGFLGTLVIAKLIDGRPIL